MQDILLFFCAVVPNVLTVGVFCLMAWLIYRDSELAHDYVEEVVFCLSLLLISHLGHILWIASGFNTLSLIIDPLSLTVVSSITYKMWKDKHGL